MPGGSEDVVFTLDGDASSAIDALNGLVNALNAVNDSLKNIAANIAVLDDLAAALARLGEDGAVATEGMATVAEGAANDTEAAFNLSQALSDLDVKLTDLFAQCVDGTYALTDVATAAQEEINAFNLLSEGAQTSSTSVQDFNTSMTELGTMLFDGQDALFKFLDVLQTVSDAFSTSADAVTKFADAMTVLQDAATSVATAIQAEIGAEEALTVASEDASAATSRQSGMFGSEAINLLILIQALVQAGGAFLQMGMSAQDAIAHVIGLADPTLLLAKNSAQLSGYIQQLSNDSITFGVTLDAAANGLYYIISAGFDASDAMTVLKYSMEASSATGAQMQTVSNALTSVLKAYSLSANQAGAITNQMVSAVVAGKQEFQTFANVIGPLSAVASRTGVSFKEVAAAEAEMSQINPRIRQDSQDLMHLMETLSLKVDKTATAAQGLGLSFNKTHYQSLNLIDKLKYLAQVAGNDTGPAFQALLTDQTSARAAFMLLENHGKNYANILKQISTNTHSLDDAFKASESTISASVNHITGALSVLAYQFVVLATPYVKPVLEGIANALKFLANNAQIARPIMIGLAAGLAVLLGGAVVALMGFMFGLMSAWMPLVYAALAFGAAVAIVGPHLKELAQWFLHLFPDFYETLNWLHTLAGYFGGLFTQGIQKAGTMLRQLGGWIHANVIPPLMLIITYLIRFGTSLLAQVIPAVDGFLKNLQPLGAFIMGSIVPEIGNFIKGAMALGVYISANLGPILNAIKTVFMGVAIATTSWKLASIALKVAQMDWPAIIGALKTVVLQAIPALWGMAAAAWSTASAFIMANLPLILIAGAIALVIAGFVLLLQRTGGLGNAMKFFMAIVKDVWNVLMASLKPVLQQIQTTVQTQLIPAWQHLMTALQPVIPVLQGLAVIVGGVLVVALGILISILAGVIGAIGGFLKGIIQAVGGIVQFFSGMIQTITGFFQWLRGIFTGNQNDIEQGQRTFLQGLHDSWNGLCNIVMGLVNAFVGAIGGFFGTLVTTIISFFTHLWHELVGGSIVPDMLSQMVAAFLGFINKVVTDIYTFVMNLITHFIYLQTMLTNAVNTLVQRLVNYFVQLGVQAAQKFQAMITSLGTLAANLANQALQWGLHFMQQMAAGVIQAGKGVIAAAQNIANSVAKLLHFSVPDEGPLADAEKWMPDFGNLLAEGLHAQVGKVALAARNVSASIALSAPSPSSLSGLGVQSQNDTSVLDVLKQILFEMQQQRKQQGALSLSSTNNIGSLFNQFGGGNLGNMSLNELYQQLNKLAGVAFEYGNRGAAAGV